MGQQASYILVEQKLYKREKITNNQEGKEDPGSLSGHKI